MRRACGRCRYRHARGIGTARVDLVTAAAVDLLPVARPGAAGRGRAARRPGCRPRNRGRNPVGRLVLSRRTGGAARCSGLQRQRRRPVAARELAAALNRAGPVGAVVRLPRVRRQPGPPDRGRPGRRRPSRAGVAGRAARRRPRPDRLLRRIPRRRSGGRTRGASGRRRRWCCGRRSRRWPTSARCTTRGCRCGGCCSTATRRSTASRRCSRRCW